jgi:hypothetical protein
MRVLVITLYLAMVGVGAAGAPTSYSRSFEVLDLRLGAGQALGVGLHPTAEPIEVSSSQPNLEVCPDGWPSFAGFIECTPLERDGTLTLPSTVLSTFHLGIRIQGIDGQRVRAKRVRINYQPGDGYFMYEPPPVPPGARTSTLVVTPKVRASVGVGPYYLRGLESENATTSMTPLLRQGRKRVMEGGPQINGRTEKTFGPVKLGRRVRITAKNPSDERRFVAFLVDWN